MRSAGSATSPPPGPGPAVDEDCTERCFEVRFGSVSLLRRGQLLLDGLSAVLAPGDTLSVMGRSGAGKTTLLRTAVGLAPPSIGAVQRASDRVAMVFQEPRLLPWRTARQNVELVLEPSKKDRARAWLDRVGLGDALDVFPAALSGGMRQRVSIARALAYEAPLVVVDEPSSHLDTLTARRLRAELATYLHDSGAAALWVTHDPEEAVSVSARTLVMAGPPDGAWTIVDHRAAASPAAAIDRLLRELAPLGAAPHGAATAPAIPERTVP